MTLTSLSIDVNKIRLRDNTEWNKFLEKYWEELMELSRSIREKSKWMLVLQGAMDHEDLLLMALLKAFKAPLKLPENMSEGALVDYFRTIIWFTAVKENKKAKTLIVALVAMELGEKASIGSDTPEDDLLKKEWEEIVNGSIDKLTWAQKKRILSYLERGEKDGETKDMSPEEKKQEKQKRDLDGAKRMRAIKKMKSLVAPYVTKGHNPLKGGGL